MKIENTKEEINTIREIIRKLKEIQKGEWNYEGSPLEEAIENLKIVIEEEEEFMEKYIFGGKNKNEKSINR